MLRIQFDSPPPPPLRVTLLFLACGPYDLTSSSLVLVHTLACWRTHTGPHLRAFFLADGFLEPGSPAACIAPHQAPLCLLRLGWLPTAMALCSADPVASCPPAEAPRLSSLSIADHRLQKGLIPTWRAARCTLLGGCSYITFIRAVFASSLN